MASHEPINLVFIVIFITLATLASHATSPALYEASLAEKHEQWMAKHGPFTPMLQRRNGVSASSRTMSNTSRSSTKKGTRHTR
ncbi:hypothetical protein ACLB2K_022925 [Fragaria x ananassa]